MPRSDTGSGIKLSEKMRIRDDDYRSHTVGRKEFIEENPEAVKKFMDAYKESVEYVNQHVEEASALIEEYNIVSAAVAEKALPYCNIVFIEGEEMKNKLSGYLNVLAEQNPKSIGGKIPEDEFYYFR